MSKTRSSTITNEQSRLSTVQIWWWRWNIPVQLGTETKVRQHIDHSMETSVHVCLSARKEAQATVHITENNTVNDKYKPKRCSFIFFASRRTSTMRDVFRRSRYVTRLNSSSSQLLWSVWLKVLQNYNNHTHLITREHSHNKHHHLFCLVHNKHFRSTIVSIITQVKEQI